MRAYRGPAFNSASAYVRKFFNLKRLIDPGLCKPTSLLYSSRVISSSSSESLLLIVKCIDHTTKHGHQCKSVMLLAPKFSWRERASRPMFCVLFILSVSLVVYFPCAIVAQSGAAVRVTHSSASAHGLAHCP